MCLEGFLPTLCTSSRIWSFADSVHRELLPEELMAAHGLSNYNFSGLTTLQAHSLIGNSMSATTLCVALIPLLLELGHLAAKRNIP